MLQPFKLVDELGRYQAMARMDWEQADSENRALRDLGNGRRWVPDLFTESEAEKSRIQDDWLANEEAR